MFKGNNLIEKERQKIANRTTDKSSFIARNVALNYLLIYLLYPIAAIYSAFTQGGALFVYLDRVINHSLAAIVFTVAVAVVIELAKYFFGKAVSDDTRQHVWTESRHHVIAFILKLVAFVGVFAFSITLSLTGAPDVAQDYRESRLPVADRLINTDSINTYYDTKIEAERADIAAAERMTWRGAIVADGRAIIKTAKTNIKDYENQKAAALADAAQTNNQRRDEYEAETATAGNWLTGFAGLGEALALLILFFAGNYESGAEAEVLTGSTGHQTSHQATALTANTNGQFFSQNTAVTNQPPDHRRPIGFELPNSHQKGAVNNSGHYNSEPQHTGKGAVKVGQCLQCGADYEQTVWNKKFCSEDCRLDHHAEKNNGKRFNPKRYHAKK